MAGDWIKMEVCLPDKPEVWRMASILNIDADSVVGKLLRVWSWFDSHTEDGNAVGVSYSLIDRVSGVVGFAEAMALSGWLIQNGHVLSLPKFERHNGKTAKNRALTNDRVAKHRKSNAVANEEANAVSNAHSVSKTVTREEKRREEEIHTSPSKRTPRKKTVAAQLPEDWRPDVGEVSRLAREFDLPESAIAGPYVEAFRDSCMAKGYEYKDFAAAFRNCVRQDWPKLRRNGKVTHNVGNEVVL